jgi:phosphoglycolate phosphatase
MIEETLRRLGATDDLDEMLAEFLVYYGANVAQESRRYPGAVTALKRLASQGATLAVCTNKREYLSRLSLISKIISRRSRDGIPSRWQSRILVT